MAVARPDDRHPFDRLRPSALRYAVNDDAQQQQLESLLAVWAG
jgi:hypothetical protein